MIVRVYVELSDEHHINDICDLVKDVVLPLDRLHGLTVKKVVKGLDRHYEHRRDKRLLNLLDRYVGHDFERMELLFRRAKSNGWSLQRKAFVRDVLDLAVMGEVLVEKRKRGRGGFALYVKRNLEGDDV